MLTNEYTIPAPAAATPSRVSCEIMTQKEFRTFVADTLGRRGERGNSLNYNYDFVEYFDADAGLIVFAHRSDIYSDVDGIHPMSLSRSIQWPGNSNCVFGVFGAPGYCVHLMTRRSQGGMVMAAFPEAQTARDPVAQMLQTEGRFRLECINSARGPIVAVYDSEGPLRVISRLEAVEAQVAA